MDRGRVPCPTCGPIGVADGDFEVHVNREDGFRLATLACPGCGELLATASAGRIDAALRAGARTRELRPPRPPLSADDLLDLHERLADEDWCARFVGGDA